MENVFNSLNLLGEIFSYLDLKDIAHFRAAAKKWRKLAERAQLWKPILHRSFPQVRILEDLQWKAVEEVFTSLKDVRNASFEPKNSYTVGVLGCLGELIHHNDSRQSGLEKAGLLGAFSCYMVGQIMISICMLSIPSVTKIEFLLGAVHCWLIQVDGKKQHWENDLNQYLDGLGNYGIRHGVVLVNSVEISESEVLQRCGQQGYKVITLRTLNEDAVDMITREVLSVSREHGETARMKFEKSLEEKQFPDQNNQNKKKKCIIY